jgi:predicted transcriptional regulator
MSQVTITLTRDRLAALDKLAKDAKSSREAVAGSILLDALDRADKPKSNPKKAGNP